MNKKIICLLFLASSINASYKSRDLDEQLYNAAYQGNLELVQKALKNGANVNAVFNDYFRILQAAAAAGHVEIINELLKAGAIIDKRDEIGTALHHAVKNQKINAIKSLIASNAEVNIYGFADRMPLYLALLNRDIEAVKILLKAGANYRNLDSYCQSPLDTIVGEFLGLFKNEIDQLTSNCANEIALVIPIKPLAKLISEYVHGIYKVSRPTLDEGHSQLLDAVGNCYHGLKDDDEQLKHLKKILDSGVSVNLAKDEQHILGYYSPLAKAASNNSLEAVKLLVQAKADIDYPITNALAEAAINNNAEIVKYLLDSKASLKTHLYYKNVFDNAIANLCVELVSILLEHNKKTAEVDISKLYYHDKKIALLPRNSISGLSDADNIKLNQIIDLVASNFNEYFNAISTSFKPDAPKSIIKIIMSYMFWHTRYLEEQPRKAATSRCVIA